MNITAIEWCDMTFNPVTGCKHGCEYCYARRIAKRFGHSNGDGGEHLLDTPMLKPKDGTVDPYPYEFDPTFHRYRLGEPRLKTKTRSIFVCSMADLFGPWVPTKWIVDVLDACLAAPQHRYLFLTKNPTRYIRLARAGKLPAGDNFWYGSTTTDPDMTAFWADDYNTFVSIEPLLAPFGSAGVDATPMFTDWAIIGAEIGNRKDKVVPKREWVEEIVGVFHAAGKPVFMKDSLIPVVGEENMCREFPW